MRFYIRNEIRYVTMIDMFHVISNTGMYWYFGKALKYEVPDYKPDHMPDNTEPQQTFWDRLHCAKRASGDTCK